MVANSLAKDSICPPLVTTSLGHAVPIFDAFEKFPHMYLKCTLGFLRGSLVLDAFNVPQSDVSP